MKIFENKTLNERYFYEKHPSGLNIYLVPKSDYKSCYVIIGTKFGSINKMFKYNSKIIETPEGIAHFLEHKLFECKEGDAFELFSKTGANSNAFTSFDKTAYLFSCCDHLKESLKILLNFVQEPYFTEKGVNKEKGIIGQEIKMYEDSPEWRARLRLLQSLYKNHPVRDDIAGSVESIARITPDMLNDCYNAFYNFENMTLCIVGNFNEDDILDYISKNISKESEKFSTEPLFPDEPNDISESNVIEKMEVVNPVFYIGFKHHASSHEISCKDFICFELILNILTLGSGDMYNLLLDEELITTNSFDFEFFNGPYYKSSIFSGESKDPKRIFDIIKKEISKVQLNGFKESEFERAKKGLYYKFVSLFNNVSSLANVILDLDFSNIELFDLIDCVSKININDVNDKIKKEFDLNKSCLSKVIKS